MNNLLRRIHHIYAVLVILISSALIWPVYYTSSRNPKYYHILNKVRRFHSKFCCFCLGLRLRFEVAHPLKRGQTYIYCANHTSNLDIMIMCIIAKGRFHFLGKDELLNNPVLKLFFKTIDVPVNRDSKISAFRAFKRVGENLDSGMSLIIFPEGKIDEDQYPPKLIPFKNGPFRLAIEKNIPIVPVSLINIWKRMWDDGSRYGTTPGICDIYIHKPVSTKELNIEEADVLKDHVFDIINSKLIHK